MKIVCACLNNSPVKIGDDSYECYYCKFKWRYIDVHDTVCKNCNTHGIDIKNTVCNLCRKEFNKSDYAIKKVLVFW